MDQLVQRILANAQGLGAYALVFAILVACGLGVPLPEDIALILGGYLAYQKSVGFFPMAAVGFAGILIGDSLIYFAGRRIGAGVLHGPLARVVTPEKRARVRDLFGRHGQKIIPIARFLPGVRAVTYFTAGSAHMGYLRFIIFDGIAALASAPAFVYLGFRLGGRVEWLINRMRQGQIAIFALVVLAIALFFVHRRRTPAPPAAAAVPPTPSAPPVEPRRAN